MERRIRPITDPRDKAMLNRVDMDIIHMTRKIVLIADGVLPITTLPDAALAFGGTTVWNPFAGCEAARKRRYD
jgi:hypothetical protein